MKKLLLICGSPRKRGNTSRILELLASELKEKYAVELCQITDYQVNGCLDKDIHADAVLYGTPLYGHSYSGQLKLLMDRHVALFKFVGGSEKAVDEMEILSFIKDKPVGLVVSCQGPEQDNTELIQMQFDRFCESSLTHCFGKYIFPWCSPDVDETTYSKELLGKIISDVDAQLP